MTAALELGVEKMIDARISAVRTSIFVASRAYQWLVTHARAPMVRRTVLVEINSERDIPDVSARDVCGEREFLAALLDRIDQADPAVIVIDKYFGANTCKDDARTITFRETVMRIRQKRHVIVGLLTKEHEGGGQPGLPSDYIEDFLRLDSSPDQGIVNIAEDNRKLALDWTVLAAGEIGNHHTVVTEPTISLVAALAADSKLLSKDRRLAHFIETKEQPFIAFLGKERWQEVSAHFYASEILCGTPLGRDQNWHQCLHDVTVPKALSHQIVVIGETDPNGGDMHETVVGRAAGFYLQANYIEALLDSQILASSGIVLECTVGFFFLLLLKIILLFRENTFQAVRRIILLVAVSYFCLYFMVVNFRYYLDPFPTGVLVGVVPLLDLLLPERKRQLISISPKSASVVVGAACQFILESHSADAQAVSWAINDTVGGDDINGRISSAGRYVAPISVPTPSKILVRATVLENSATVLEATIVITRMPATRKRRRTRP
jgi:hypothetical protein